MATPVSKERILVVESNPIILDLIARQSLRPLGYQVRGVELASIAIREVVQFQPQVVITNLILPDLSGKDLLVALAAQGIDLPIILIAEEGREIDVIQGFRLGASDYLSWPIREAEVVSAVERAVKNVRARQERERLALKLNKTNLELQRRVKELTTIFSLGKAVTSITTQQALFDKVLEGAVAVSEADRGWLLVRDEHRKAFVLKAASNLPKSIAAQINQPLDDGISTLVALSGESLMIHGTSMERFKISRLGKAALVMPIKAQKEVIGLLVVVRVKAQPFKKSDQSLLEAVADYASISLVNARLFQALEERALNLQKAVDEVKSADKQRKDILRNAIQELQSPLQKVKKNIDDLLEGKKGRLRGDQKEALTVAQVNNQRALEIIHKMTVLHESVVPRQLTMVNLSDLARQVMKRCQEPAQKAGVELVETFPPERVFAQIDPQQISHVFQHLVTNAIKCSREGGYVRVRVDPPHKGFVHVSVEDNGSGIEKEKLPHLFDRFPQSTPPSPNQPGEEGMGLSLVKETITTHGGKIWVESQPGKGSTFHFALPQS